jgi:hypothetical protein
MGCRIEIWPVDKDGTLTWDAAPGRKYRLWDALDDRFLENKSGSAPLEYCSRRAARRGREKFCQHDNEWHGDPTGLEPLPQIDGSERARDNAKEVVFPNVCDYCEEEGDVDDPLGEWITLNNRHRLAHGQCGLDAGWRAA